MGLLSWFKNTSNHSITHNAIDRKNIGAETREFEFIVRDVFYIDGKGLVVTGDVSLGSINVNDTVYLEKSDGQTKEVIIECIETFRIIKKRAERGESVGIVIRNAKRKEVIKGNILYR